MGRGTPSQFPWSSHVWQAPHVETQTSCSHVSHAPQFDHVHTWLKQNFAPQPFGSAASESTHLPDLQVSPAPQAGSQMGSGASVRVIFTSSGVPPMVNL